MGFGSFISHLVAPVTHILGPVGTAALLPAIPLSQIAANVIDVATAKVGATLLGPGQTVAPAAPSQPYTHSNVPQPYAREVAPIQYYYPAQPQVPQYGGTSSWDYSTPSIPYSAPQSPMFQDYSAPQAQGPDRSWEDLILGSSLFL